MKWARRKQETYLLEQLGREATNEGITVEGVRVNERDESSAVCICVLAAGQPTEPTHAFALALTLAALNNRA